MATFDEAIREYTKVHPKAVASLRERVGSSDVRQLGAAADGKLLTVVTDDQLLVGRDKGDGFGWKIADLRSISVLPDGERSLLAPLGSGEFYSFGLEPGDAERIAAAVRQLLPPTDPGAAWWDDPQATIGTFLRALALLVRPSGSPHHEKTICNVSFANTGVQIFSYKDPRFPQFYQGDITEFVPWSAVHSVTVEGLDQVERRPSVGAVLVFGLMGLAASQAVRRSYLVVATDAGDFFFEQQDMLPSALAARIGPVLRLFIQPAAASEGVDVGELLIETNRLLGEILEELRTRPADQ